MCGNESPTRNFRFVAVMVRGVIFDMDGVLVDNLEAHETSFELFCAKYELPFKKSDLNNLYGRSNDAIMPALFGRELSKEEILQFENEKEALYREVYAETIEPARGIVEYIKALKNKGFRIAVGSSAPPENIDFVLDSCDIRHYFDAIAHARMVSRAKPEPDIFLAAAKLMGVEPENCLVFEDALAGIEAAHRAGMKVVALPTTNSKERIAHADLVIDSFCDMNLEITAKLFNVSEL